MKTPGPADSKFAVPTVDFCWRIGVFFVTANSTYLLLALGLRWIVVAFAAGCLLYGLWLVFEERKRTLNPNFGAVESAILHTPPEHTNLRARVMDELVWGNTDPEVMAFAGNVAGPKGNIVAKYIELRMAQLAAEEAANAERLLG